MLLSKEYLPNRMPNNTLLIVWDTSSQTPKTMNEPYTLKSWNEISFSLVVLPMLCISYMPRSKEWEFL